MTRSLNSTIMVIEMGPLLQNFTIVMIVASVMALVPCLKLVGSKSNPGAVVDGYYLIINPLTKGEHKLIYEFTQEQKIPGADLSRVDGDATYFLTVNI